MAEPELTDYTPPPPSANNERRPLPTEVIISPNELEIGFTPRELRLIKETFGRSYSQIVADDADDEHRFMVMAWLDLRRRGYDPTLDDMDDILIRIRAIAEPPDPTSGPPSPTLPGSVISGT